MPHVYVCPWWLTCTFDNPLRRLLHDPVRLVAPFVRPGDRVAGVGCGMSHEPEPGTLGVRGYR